MPNPSGKNQLPGGDHEIPYGGVKRQQELTRSAPLSGAPTAALNAPRRAQRQAVKGKRGQARKQPKVLQRPKDAFHPTSAPPPDIVPHEQEMASIWGDIAAIPGVTSLAQELAVRAASGGV